MTLKSVGKGARVQQELKADTWNAFVRAANANDLRSNVGDGRPGTGQERPYSTVKVLCSAGQVAKREVLGLKDPAILPSAGQQSFDTRLLFGQSTPIQGAFGLAELAGAQNVFNPVIADGVVQCKLFVPANGGKIQRADIDPSDATRLLATPNGSAQILWQDAGTNTTVDAIVRLGNQEYVEVIGKLNNPASAPATPGSSNNVVNVWGEGVDTGYQITGVHLDWMDGNQNISHDKEVVVGWFPGEKRWRFVGAECEDNPPAAGQLVDNGPTTQALTGTPAPINAFSAAAQGTISTANVTLQGTNNSSIQLPDVPASGHVYRVGISGTVVPDNNNVAYDIDLFLNGALAGTLLTLDGRQAGTSLSFSFNELWPLTAQSAPVLDLRISMATGSNQDVDWSAASFTVERNLDF